MMVQGIATIYVISVDGNGLLQDMNVLNVVMLAEDKSILEIVINVVIVVLLPLLNH
jgi:hypothetical protein